MNELPPVVMGDAPQGAGSPWLTPATIPLPTPTSVERDL